MRHFSFFYRLQRLCTVALFTLLFTPLLVLLPSTALTQTLPPDCDELLEAIAQETNVSPQTDIIEYYTQNPLSLRYSTAKVLSALPGFSLRTARSIINFVKDYPNTTYAEIRDSLRLSREQRLLLEQCTTLASGLTDLLTGALRYRLRSQIELNPVRGFTSGVFQGSRPEIYQRLSYRSHSGSAGSSMYSPVQYETSITTEKDAGERSLTDFLSGTARITVSSTAHTTSIIAGDYTIESGTGNLLWRTYANRKGIDIVAPAVQYSFAVQPYRSVVEQQFFRGAAAQTRLILSTTSTLNMMGWVSSTKRAATLDSTARIGSGLLPTATSLDMDGLFRTASEIAKRDALTERSAGAGAEWSSENGSTAWSLGATAFVLDYSAFITSRSTSSFYGANGVLASVFGNATFGQWFVTGELSRDGQGNPGGRIGAQTSNDALELAAAFRSFSSAFRSPFGSNFGEYSQPANETGLYLSLLWKGTEHLRVLSYLDLYDTPSPTTTVPTRVHGVDIFSEVQYSFNEGSFDDKRVLVRLRYENKTDAMTVQDAFNRDTRIVYDRERVSVRAELQQHCSESLQTRFRLECVTVNFANHRATEYGGLVFGDIVWQALPPLRVWARGVLFSTPSFESALWQFEPSIPGTLSNPPLYGTGLRGTLTLRYEPSVWLSVWLRGELTKRTDVDVIGSGLLQVQGNVVARLSIQADVKL